LIDYGLAKLVNEKNTRIFTSRKSEFPMVYSSPEQLLNYFSLVNATSDLYSAGITLYELLTGNVPFIEQIPIMLMTRIITCEIPVNRKIPKELFPILQKVTSKFLLRKPPNRYTAYELKMMLIEGQKNRYQTAEEMQLAFIDVLRQIEHSKEIRKGNLLKAIFQAIWK
jgi:serine/threonine protein kinase